MPQPPSLNLIVHAAFTQKDIERVSTTCVRHKNGKWLYTGKVYFSKNQLKQHKVIHGTSQDHLTAELKKYMKLVPVA